MTPAEFVASILGNAPGLSGDVATVLQGMRSEIGYQERGGRLIVDETTRNNVPGFGDVIGRTVWIGERWWFDRPDASLSAQQARAAVDKALAGFPLGSREQRFIDYALAECEFRIHGERIAA